MKYKIGIVGATSYIAQNLIEDFSKKNHYNLILLARSPEKIECDNKNVTIDNINNFNNYHYDVIINCIKIRKLLEENISDLFFINEKYDNLIIEKLKKQPNIIYIYFSSGAVYGEYLNPINKDTKSIITINDIKFSDYYCINKIYTEAKHRSLKKLNIIDIRLFSFFSKFIDRNSNYFINHIINSIKNNREFITNSNNIIRDYIHPDDLIKLIECCIYKKNINDFFDTYSTNPINKIELLNFFVEKYNLKYSIENNISIIDETGNKNIFYSTNYKAKKIGYIPQFSSLDTIKDQIKFLF